jgi:hypothetical protein
MNRSCLRPIVAGVAMGLVLSVLGFYGSSIAQVPNAPFGNAVELQGEIINQLKLLNASVKEQNALLRSGRLQVVVVEKKREGGR